VFGTRTAMLARLQGRSLRLLQLLLQLLDSCIGCSEGRPKHLSILMLRCFQPSFQPVTTAIIHCFSHSTSRP
jgi:hypothetical protein